MNEGWFKIYRCLFKKVIWLKSTPEQKVILITLLGMANHEECEWEWNGKQFKVKAGEFITSSSSIMNKSGLGISRQNVRTALAKFQKHEFLTYVSTKEGIIVSIVNWGLYQGEKTEINQEFNQEVTKASPRTNQGLTTNKNDKNYKNDKNINNISKMIHIDNKDISDYEFANSMDKQKEDKENTDYKRSEENNDGYTFCKKDKKNNEYTRFEDINYIYQKHECIDRNVKKIKSSKYNKNTNKYRYMNEFTRNKLLIETIIDFMKMRDEIKKPMTDRALQLMLRKLRNLSLDEQIQIKILENSIENCWQGIFPLRDDNNGTKGRVQLEKDRNRVFTLMEGKYGGVRKNIGPSEKKFNIKIPKWTPSPDGEFKDQNIGGKFESGNEAEPF